MLPSFDTSFTTHSVQCSSTLLPICILFGFPFRNWIFMEFDGSVSSVEHNYEFARYHTAENGLVMSPDYGPEQCGADGKHRCTVSDDNHCLVTTSPNGATCWIPLCAEHLTPQHDQLFPSIDVGIQFYRTYAAA